MQSAQTLQPTLWRTCRALANRTRLRMLCCLFDQPGQTVSSLAARAGLSLSATSLHLRALESRSLLEVKRSGRFAIYRPASAQRLPTHSNLLVELRRMLRREPGAVESVFRQATAFTHPRRIEIVRLLAGKPMNPFQISASMRIPFTSLSRHLAKLASREFIVKQDAVITLKMYHEGLRRQLLELALAGAGTD